METSHYGQLELQCPFYSGSDNAHAGKKILCESPVPGSNLGLYFRKKEDYLTQMRVFCCQHYKKCEIYRAVMEAKYETE